MSKEILVIYFEPFFTHYTHIFIDSRAEEETKAFREDPITGIAYRVRKLMPICRLYIQLRLICG